MTGQCRPRGPLQATLLSVFSCMIMTLSEMDLAMGLNVTAERKFIKNPSVKLAGLLQSTCVPQASTPLRHLTITDFGWKAKLALAMHYTAFVPYSVTAECNTHKLVPMLCCLWKPCPCTKLGASTYEMLLHVHCSITSTCAM